MKLLTFHGPGHFFEVPGHFTLAAGESHKVDDELADTLVSANPHVELTIEAAPERSKSKPAARKGEGQPTAIDQKE